MSSHIDTLNAAVSSLRAQFSVTHGKQSDNIEVLQEFAEAFMAELQQLVWQAGGNSEPLTPIVEGIRNDIDLCFFAENNAVVKDVFKPRAGLLKLIVQGANMGAGR
jgi:hypothetical protein